MHMTCWKQQKGQGLIEVLIVAIIILLASVALITFQATISYQDSVALQRSDATDIALSEIETLRDYDVLTTQGTYIAYGNIASSSGSATNNNTTFTVTWTVTTNSTIGYKTISVAVTWTDIRGVSQTVTLVTDVAALTPVFSATVLY